VADTYAGDSAPEVVDSVADDDAEARAKADEAKLLEEAKQRFALALEAESENRRLALEDDKFAAGEQWDSSVKNERAADGRPCLVVNRIQQSLQQITNDQRQNRPSIKVHAVDDAADVETAKIIQGLIRHIEYNSSADTAYDTAFDGAARGGWGYFRIVTDYCDPKSFDQEILIKRIRSRFSVAFDPASVEPDGSDASFAFVEEVLPKADYEAKYPESKLAAQGEWDALGSADADWLSGAGARVVEYFYKDTREDTLLQLSSGESVLDSELDDEMRVQLAAAGVTIVRERSTLVPVIKWCKFNGCEVLEQTEWPGRWIPIIPVYGAEHIIDGKRILSGLVRNSKDPQRMYNYMVSAEAEAIGLAPKSPFIGYAGQFEGREREWMTANRRNHSYLEVNPVMIGGSVAPLPQRNSIEPAVMAITQAKMGASEDVKASTGIFDAALGNRSNESSGIAIQRRASQAQTANFHFVDNLTRSLRHAGRILVDLIPHVYDTARAARIIGEDGEQKVVQVNAPDAKEGRLYDVTTGKYDVTVDVGPSFASKRQEAQAALIELTKAVPQVGQVGADVLVRTFDWQGATELAERLKKMLPPQLQDQQKGQAQIPPQIQAQLEQQGAMVEQLSQQLHAAMDEKEKKLIEIESRERIEMKKLEVQLEIERAKLDQAASVELLSAEIAQINARQAQLHADQPIPFDDVTDPSAGGVSAYGAEEPVQDPTGGESPGQPMEQSSDEPEPVY
jgi:hypothetical protein